MLLNPKAKNLDNMSETSNVRLALDLFELVHTAVDT
jgi:hypothetical protein